MAQPLRYNVYCGQFETATVGGVDNVALTGGFISNGISVLTAGKGQSLKPAPRTFCLLSAVCCLPSVLNSLFFALAGGLLSDGIEVLIASHAMDRSTHASHTHILSIVMMAR